MKCSALFEVTQSLAVSLRGTALLGTCSVQMWPLVLTPFPSLFVFPVQIHAEQERLSGGLDGDDGR